jgi:rhomboid protease GluP
LTHTKELWLYRLATRLVQEYGYHIVDVRIQHSELWLNHPDRPDYGLIRLSVATGFQLKNIEERTLKIKDVLMNLMPEIHRFWDVQIDEEGSLKEPLNDREFCVISPEAVDHPLFESFPNLKQAFTPSEKPEEELKSLQHTYQKLRQPKKLSFKERLRFIPKLSYGLAILASLITLAIRLLNVAGFDLFASAIFMGAYYKTFIEANHEYWRFITAGFVHIDFIHLLMNMVALISFGTLLERTYGSLRVGLVLLVGIFFGSFFVFAVQGNILLVGMSAGIYALLGLMLVFFFETGIIRQPAVQTQMLRLALINILLNFLPQVSFLGHLGGFMGGILMGIVLTKKESWKPMRIHAFIASVLLVVSLGYLSVTNTQSGPLYGRTDRYVLDIAQAFNLTEYVERMQVQLIRYYEDKQ